MDFRDYLTLANNLVNGRTEGEWRTAISRAYYSAFHVARGLLSDLSFRVPPQRCDLAPLSAVALGDHPSFTRSAFFRFHQRLSFAVQGLVEQAILPGFV